MCLPGTLFGQRYSFKHYGQDEGLTSLVAQCMLQDRTGFLWVGTQNGLFRYDGTRFRGFYKTEGLPSSRIESLYEGTDGTLWVGTRSGLAQRVGDRFGAVRISQPYEILGRSAIASDTRGQIYASTSEGLLTGRPNPQKSSLDWRLESPGGLHQAIHSVHVDPGGALWLGCGNRLCRFQEGQVVLMGPEDGVPEDRWDAILTDPAGNLWVRSSQRLLLRPPGKTRFTRLDAGLPESTNVSSLHLDSEGRLFVPTDLGMAYRVAGHWERIDSRKGLAADSVCCLLQDREGSLWVGLFGSGVARWLGYRQWESWTLAEGLSNENTWGIYRDPSGTLWVGTDNGLNAWPSGHTTWRHWTKQQGLGGNKVRTLAAGSDGTVWVGSDPGGVSQMHPRLGIIHHYGVESGLLNDRVLSMAEDRQHRLWVGTRRGLYRSAGAGAALRFQQQWPPSSDENERFYGLLRDSQGRVWIAGSRGLVRFDNGQWTRFTVRDGLSTDFLGYLTEAQDGAIWIGYREAVGISRLTFSEGRLRIDHITRQNGLHSDQAIFLGVDTRGWIWFGTDSGVDVFDGRLWTHHSRADGLLWDDCNGDAFFADWDGGVWIGTSRGLAHFHPPDRPLPGIAPPVVISSVQFGRNRLEPPSGPLKIPYADRSFLAAFTALTFLREQEVRFRYRLWDLQKEWMETTQREVQYPSLPPGDYNFQVQARSAQGIWSDAPAQVSFRILSPWWQTWWFRGAILTAALFLGWLLWHLRVRLLLEQRRRLEAAVETRTRELAAEQARTEQEKAIVELQNREIEVLLKEAQQANRLKGEFLANMSHEIRTPMNGVLGMQTLALATSLSSEQREYLETAQFSAESLLCLLNDILDFSKIEAGRLELSAVDFSVQQAVSCAVKTLAVRAQQKNLLLTCQISPEAPDMLVGDPARLRQILLNLIGNAIKFTETGGITIRVEPEPVAEPEVVLHFAVADTGIGIPSEKHSVIFEAFRQADGSTTRKYGGTGLGLGISSKLVELMGGRIWMESQVGRGSTFHFTAQFRRALAPLAQPGKPPSAPPEACLDSRTAGPSLRILVAEDNRVNEKLAVRLLQKMGHSTVVARDGRQALDALAQQAFDLVLMDVQMPEMDGLEATRLIRQQEQRTGAHLPIVAMTAHAMKGDRERCLKAGMDGYLSKPIQPKELLEAIQQAAGAVHSVGG